MIELNIPGKDPLHLEHLVLDVEGTLTIDGRFIDELYRPLQSLKDRLKIHLLTIDPFKQQKHLDLHLGIKSHIILPASNSKTQIAYEADQKKHFVTNLGPQNVVAIGQGADDSGMLQAAALGIYVLSSEGGAVETMLSADIVVPNMHNAIELLIKPMRIVSTLRC